MNELETLKLLKMIQSTYSSFKISDVDLAAEIWQSMLVDYTPNEVANALRMHIAISKYPPTIADIIEQINSIKYPQIDNYEQAWAKVLKACRHTGTLEAWSDLPEDIKSCTDVTSLREWAVMDSEIVNTVVKSNWLKAYKQVKDRQHKYQALPNKVKQLFKLETRNRIDIECEELK
ncbi:MAG: replicative helicase loader/inhibitor [Longicatena sp.]